LEEEQLRNKRGLFAPVMMLLLTFSLIGNVFLYANQMQTKQQDRQTEGMLLIKQAADAKLYFSSVLQQVDSLLKSDDRTSRLAAAYGLGQDARHADSLRQLIEAAGLRHANPALQRPALDFLSRMEQSLGVIATHDGPLTEEERTYLTSVKEAYAKLSTAANGINTEFNTPTAALKMQSGGEWVVIMNGLMEEMGASHIRG
jgi:hypothetical protein